MITLSTAYNDLTQHPITSWDREGGFVVVHEKIGPLRVVIAVRIQCSAREVVGCVVKHNCCAALNC